VTDTLLFEVSTPELEDVVRLEDDYGRSGTERCSIIRRGEANVERTQIDVPDKLFYKASEVCQLTDTQPYVLRFWESEFPSSPERRTAAASASTAARTST
jgi:hypothetical protein